MTIDQDARESYANELLKDVGEDFDFDLFWYLVDHGTPQIDGSVEHQLARRFAAERPELRKA